VEKQITIAANPRGEDVAILTYSDLLLARGIPPDNNKVIKVKLPSGTPECIAINYNTRPPTFYVTNSQNTLYIINAKTDGEKYGIINTVKTGEEPSGIAYNPDNFNVYVTNARSNNISVIDGEGKTDQAITTIKSEGTPFGIAYNPHDKFLYVPTSDAVLLVIDGKTNDIVDRQKIGGSSIYSAVACTQSGKVFVADSSLNEVIVMDLPHTNQPSTIKVGLEPYHISLDPLDNTKLYVANIGSNDVSIIDTNEEFVISTIRFDSPYSVACSSRSFGYVHSRDRQKLYILDYNKSAVIDVIRLNPDAGTIGT
jgi:YVTN family beta-propeller protein